MIASYQKYALIFKKPAGTSRGYLYRQENYFLRLSNQRHSPQFGLGECGPLVGLSIDDRPDFDAKLSELCASLNRGTPPEALDLTDWPSVAFGLETALLDLRRGGQRQLFETPFSRGETALPIHGLIWMAQPDALMTQIRQKITDGFHLVKLKVGALDFERECQLLESIRAHFPVDQLEIRLDANGAFSPQEAPAKLAQLAQYGISVIEQPIKPGQWPALAELCTHSPIPIALDEELIGVKTEPARAALLEAIKPQVLVLKPTLIGGLAAAEAWLKAAESRGIGWWVNSALESNIGLNVIAQWVSSRKTERVQGLGTGGLYTNNIPAPIQRVGSGLIYDPAGRWDVSMIAETGHG